MECLTSLVGIKELCAPNAVTPFFWLDDAEGIDRVALSQITKPSVASGLTFGQEIIDSSARFLLADIETLIPKGYSISNSLNSFCNVCTYTTMSTDQPMTGVIVKNVSTSKNAYLSIDSLKVMLNSTGTFTVVLDDGIAPKNIQYAFTAGTEVDIININFKTSSKTVKIYMLEPGVYVTALSCPTQKSCGCSGQRTGQSTDITVKGLLADTEFTTQYGFVPCATIVCSLDNILCTIVNQQPRLFGLALFYRSVARYFSEFPVTQRNNRNASFDTKEKIDLSMRYMELYYERLRGSGNVLGIADNMAAALDSVGDPCIVCKRPMSTAWAIS